MKVWEQRNPDAKYDLQVTEAISDQVIVLPGGAAISRQEVIGVCDLLDLILRNASNIKQRLAEDNFVTPNL